MAQELAPTSRPPRETATLTPTVTTWLGRDAGHRLAWADAYRSLSLAEQSAPLAAEDLELLATAAYLLGHVPDCLQALQRAHRAHRAHVCRDR